MSVVIEFVHTATLLHDDVIDHAKIRRGRTSANNIWGNAASVLVGDFLYSMSFKLMTADGNLDIMRLISSTTASMSEGEVYQLMKCGDVTITEAQYLSIIEKKTSFLISAACAVGGILGGAGDADIGALTKFGLMLGSAFQITDDTLDYLAKEEEFGKSIGQDFQEGKITLPLIHTLRKCSPAEGKLIRKAIGRKRLTAETIAEVISLIRKYGGAGYALDKARQYIEEGKEFLRHFEDSEDKASLLTISDFILERRL
jgi:octaprenyl-diphosphate synthase